MDKDDVELALDFMSSSSFEKLFKFGRGLYEVQDEKRKIKIGEAYQKYILVAKSKLSKIKSFFITDGPKDFYQYYVPVALSSGRYQIPEPNIERSIRENDRVVITGTGGSGKSILMRHLFLDCISGLRYAPILIELRDLNDSERTIEEHVFYVLQNGGFDVGGSFVKRSMEAGNFCFLFDGFDELVESKRREVGEYIKEISLRYLGCPVIVSSRPDERFSGWGQFSVLNVAPLSKNVAIQLVSKLPVEDDVKSKFILELNERLFEEHKSFLSNPLLLSIMLLTYHENAEVPKKLSLFYSQAYEALFQKHDAAKGAYSRKKLTDLDILDFSKVFSLFSLLTYDKRVFRMTKMDCLNYIEESKARSGFDFDRNDFMRDLLDATCLLIDDGVQVAYSHRSFQEYFVSTFILKEGAEVQRGLLERYWDPTGSDSVIALTYEQNPAVVERGLLIPRLEKAFDEIGVTTDVTEESYLRYLQVSYEILTVDERGIAFTHKTERYGRKAIALGIIGTVANLCCRWENPPVEKYALLSEKFLLEAGAPSESYLSTTADLSVEPALIEVLSSSDTVFGIGYLRMVFRKYLELKNSHEMHTKSLFDLLDRPVNS
ncbi:NACHT domain-containing protein [Pseudomonas protegens]|uniref:NACHT domain-containing protein n=1 Tax=Pseudomonas protegens TaxID=380021 RepID=UPI000F494862|nr:NACHT domain-containing protein [Pseudomonas protegens]